MTAQRTRLNALETSPVALDRLTRRQLLSCAAALTAGVVTQSVALAQDIEVPDAAAENIPASAFLRAVERGDLKAVRAMLDARPALARATDGAGRSAYLLARLNARRDIADLLLERGIELDIVEAALAGQWQRVETLAAADPASVNRAHPVGGNLLYGAAIAGGQELYRLRSLGSDSNGRPQGGSGWTPARAAMAAADPLDAWLAAVDVLGNGGDVNAEQANGDTVLHGAVRARDLRLVRLAIRKGADVGARDIAGRTARELADDLHWGDGSKLLAAHSSIARDHRASRLAFTAEREPFQWTALTDVARDLQSEITSVSHFNPARVAEMLASDPRLVHAVSTDAELAVEACGHTGQREVIRIHLDHGAPLSLPTAVSLGDLEHARWLLEADPKLINERGPHDIPLLWYAAIGGDDTAALELLVDFGANIGQESAGETALHQAAFRNRPRVADALLRLGADPEAVGHRQFPEGLSPYEVAVRRGSEDVLAVFGDHGIDA